jgi:hypothetical protein
LPLGGRNMRAASLPASQAADPDMPSWSGSFD